MLSYCYDHYFIAVVSWTHFQVMLNMLNDDMNVNPQQKWLYGWFPTDLCIKDAIAGWFTALCTVPVKCHPPTVNLCNVQRAPERHNESDEMCWVSVRLCITLTRSQVVSCNIVSPFFHLYPSSAGGNCDSWMFAFFKSLL